VQGTQEGGVAEKDSADDGCARADERTPKVHRAEPSLVKGHEADGRGDEAREQAADADERHPRWYLQPP
jgi:hypothetical protein